MPIHNALDISTSHAPGPNPDFGAHRYVSHEYGWIVFVVGYLEAPKTPNWLRPIMEYAIANKCFLINFDRDAVAMSEFETYDW